MQRTPVMVTFIDRDEVRQRLHARRSELLARYGDLIETDDESDARALSVMSPGDALALEQVIAALDQLDQGSYGTCQSCRVAIEPARLHGMPEARLCLDCAAAAPG